MKRIGSWLLRLTLLFAATTMLFAAQTIRPTRIVVFGDSLSDMGNTSSLTFGLTPGSAYWQGRFSNGPVWVERLASRLALPIVRSRSSGYNYAHGGAETGYGNSSLIIPNVSTQISGYLNARNPAPTELFIVWAGGNDFLNGETNPAIPAANMEADVVRLYDRGARYFIVPTLPLLGYTPRYLGTAEEEAMNALSQAYNDELQKRLLELTRTKFGIRIWTLRVDQVIMDVRARPSYFGFENTSEPAYNGSTTAPNPDAYLFFDEIHPTAKAHRMLGDAAYRLILDRR